MTGTERRDATINRLFRRALDRLAAGDRAGFVRDMMEIDGFDYLPVDWERAPDPPPDVARVTSD